MTGATLLSKVRRGVARREPVEPEQRTAFPSSLVAERYGRRDLWLRRMLFAGDAVAVALALGLASLAQTRPGALEFVGYGLLTLPVWLVIFRMYGLYDRDVKRLSHTSVDDVPAAFHAFVVGSLFLWTFYKVLHIPQLELAEVFVFAVTGFTLVLLLRVLARKLATEMLGPARVLMVGGGDASRLLSRKLRAHPEYNAVAVGVLTERDRDGHGMPVLGDLADADLEAVIREHDVERVVISHVELDEATMLDLIRRCKRLGVKVNVLPQLFDAMGTSVTVDHVEGVTVLGLNPPVLARSARLEKRALDLTLAGVIFLVTAPLLALTALAIKLTSRGPVLFRQERIGKGGERFEVLKFRTMVKDAEAMTDELFALSRDPNWLHLERDPRVTAIGRFLRMSSLDELPQLVNVLKGDMSLVGPRPLQESEDRVIGGWGRTRLDLTPGVTGLWQVLGRTNIPFEEMVKLDYQYVTNWSLWTDVRLILQTVPAVLRQRGAN